MRPKKLKSVVVPRSKGACQVTSTTVQQGPPAKRSKNSKAARDIVMTITQPISTNTSTTTSTQRRASEAGTSHQPASFVHPPTRVQHTSNAAPFPGQHQPNLQQPSMPWWAWSPPHPPPWNWNMWSPGAFHQLTPPAANADGMPPSLAQTHGSSTGPVLNPAPGPAVNQFSQANHTTPVPSTSQDTSPADYITNPTNQQINQTGNQTTDAQDMGNVDSGKCFVLHNGTR